MANYDDLTKIGEYVFLALFSLMFVIYSIFTLKAMCKNQEMRNIFNFIQSLSIIAFLLCRILSIIW